MKSVNESVDGETDFGLVIHQVMHTDSGTYVCFIADQTEELRRFVHLDVTG